MPEATLTQALRESTEEVLEKMFFIRPLRDPQEAANEPEVAAHLTFEGEPSGSLTLSLAASTARSIAADFLGEQESVLSEQQVGEVVCELANMICGSVLSRVESTATFRLATPRIMASPPPANGIAGRTRSTVHSLETCRGSIVVVIDTEISPKETSLWLPAEKYAF